MDKVDVDERLKIVTLQKEKSDAKSGINWMYTGNKPDSEEYLLGKRIDKYVEGEDDTKSADPTVIFGERIKANIALDVAAKMREDPLFAIRRKEEESRKKLLENPIKMKELQKLIELQEKQKKEKEKKKKKKKKKHKKHKKSGDSGDSSEDDLMKKYLAILTSKHCGEGEPAQKKRKEGGSDESDNGEVRRNDGRGRKQDGDKGWRNSDVDDRRHIDKGQNDRNDRRQNDRHDRGHDDRNDRGYNDRSDRGQGDRNDRGHDRNERGHDRNDRRHSDRNDRGGKERNDRGQNHRGQDDRTDGGYKQFNNNRTEYNNDRHHKDDDRRHNEFNDRSQREVKGYDIKKDRDGSSKKLEASKGHVSQVSRSEDRTTGSKRSKRRNSSDIGSDGSEERKAHRHRAGGGPGNEKSSGHSGVGHSANRSSDRRPTRDSRQGDESPGRKRSRSAHSESRLGVEKGKGQSPRSKDRQKDKQTREGVQRNVQNEKKGVKSSSSSSSSSTSSSSSSSSSSDEEKPSEHKEVHGTGKKYGLILSGSHQPAARRRSSSSSSSPELKKKAKVETKPSVSKKPQSPPRRKLTQEEKAKKLAEMMENAEWREEQREMNVKRYKEEDLEKEKKDKQGGSGFISSLMVNHASTSSVEDRIKRNKYNIQRTRVALDKNFAKK